MNKLALQLPASKGLDGRSSVVLDLIRIFAASYVALVHAISMMNDGGQVSLTLQNTSHGCVILFFVLSGYVISFVMDVRHQSFGGYVAARLSRLHSVALPAMLLTAVVYWYLGSHEAPWLSRFYQEHVYTRVALTALFCNEIWFFSAAPLINGPFWSLGYEFWFYIIFGAFWFRRCSPLGNLILCLIILLCGPKIMLMMVPWIFGWFAYRASFGSVAYGFRWVIFFVSLLVGFAAAELVPDIPYELSSTRLYWAGAFLKDWLVGGVFAIGFAALPRNRGGLAVSGPSIWYLVSRRLGDLSYAVYAFHFPFAVLLVLLLERLGWYSVSAHQLPGIGLLIGSVAVLVGISLAAGAFAERSRPALLRFYRRVFSVLDRKAVALA